jgi:hypothetical protein
MRGSFAALRMTAKNKQRQQQGQIATVRVTATATADSVREWQKERQRPMLRLIPNHCLLIPSPRALILLLSGLEEGLGFVEEEFGAAGFGEELEGAAGA